MKTKVYVPDNVLLGMLSTYILALAGAESVGMMWGSTWGALAHAILIPVMLTHSAVTSKRATARVLLALALV
ncbi:MAG: hypothetical protein QXI12_13475, partial [Candidatus Methanomethyliaceae archaeon]